MQILVVGLRFEELRLDMTSPHLVVSGGGVGIRALWHLLPRILRKWSQGQKRLQ